VRRRDFIKGIVGSATARPLALHAQQTVIPVVGFLHPGLAEIPANRNQVAGFKEGLRQTGYVDGHNVAIEFHWAGDRYDQMPVLAAELVHRQVAVIAAMTPVAALAAKRATTSIPVVFALGSDPVKIGLVASFNRPGGNVTGATFLNNSLDAKRLDLLHQLVPTVKTVAVLLNPENPNAEIEKRETLAAAHSLGMDVIVLQASTLQEIDDSIASLGPHRPVTLLIIGDAFLNNHCDRITRLAVRSAIPTSFPNREQAMAGALMSYGASLTETTRQAGNYVGRILNGEKPGDLPVQEPTKFEFIINTKTAKELGIEIPYSVQLLADEAIE
jgi:putative tryptophan/tyrosine transport system substrate-binding protein